MNSSLASPGRTAGESGLPSAALEPISQGIVLLKGRVAKDFMALAAALQANSQSARAITAASHKATGADTSQSSSQPIAVLQGVLADSAGVTAMVDVSTRTITEILAQVKSVSTPLNRLTKMSMLLEIVSVLCRIEGGRVAGGQVDIAGLSNDIDALAAQVAEHIDGIFDDSETLNALLTDGVDQLGRFGQQERAAAHDLIARTQAMLTPALARAEASHAAARTIDEQYTAFHRATDKVVMSLQAEDLARQRIEHVEEHLHRTAAHLAAGEPASAHARILLLQRAQVLSTRDLLVGAAGSTHAALEELIPRVRKLAAETATLARQTDEDSRSLVALIDGELGTVADVFRQCAASASAVVAIVNGVLPSVETMTGRAVSLEDIEISIRLISLNATVKTSQLGTDGAAMGVLASELHGITRNGGGDTKLVLTGLLAIRQSLARITDSKSSAQGSSILTGGNADAVSASLAGLSQSVGEASQQVSAALDEVGRLAAALCDDLAKGLNLASRAASLAEVFDQVLASFDQLFEQFGIAQTFSPTEAAPKEDLVALYSMQSERTLHTQIFGGGETQQPPTASPDPGEFGDDVELF